MIVLALDPSVSSGWALFRGAGAKPLASGVARTAAEREAVVRLVSQVQAVEGGPVLVVAETWNGRSFRKGTKRLSDAALIGLGAAWGRWAQCVESLIPEAKTVRVQPKVWRKPFGLNGVTSERAKDLALRIAREKYGVQKLHTDDQAEAILIGAWARTLPDAVSSALGVRRTRAITAIPLEV